MQNTEAPIHCFITRCDTTLLYSFNMTTINIQYTAKSTSTIVLRETNRLLTEMPKDFNWTACSYDNMTDSSLMTKFLKVSSSTFWNGTADFVHYLTENVC